MARELGPQGIHVAHLVIDARRRHRLRARADRRARGGATRVEPSADDPPAIAEAYWPLHHQPREAWTLELELRPYGETW